MKKRVYALLMAGVMVLGGSICAFAEEETESAGEAVTVNYAMIDDSIYDGVWMEFFGAVDLYLPTDWTEQELTEENEALGIGYVLTDDAGDVIAVSYVDSETQEVTLDEIAEQLSESFDSVEQWTVNGIPTLVFGDDDSQTIGFGALNDQGVWYQVCMEAGEDVDQSWTLNVIASFQVHEIQGAESETEMETEA
jgi:hypothetical protein